MGFKKKFPDLSLVRAYHEIENSNYTAGDINSSLRLC